MKRICKATTVLLMILCVILMTCACATDPETNVTNSSSTESLLADRSGLYFYDYEEYLAFLDSADLPADFVEFDSLSCFGSFYSFIDISGPQPYDHYMYAFIDENGCRYNLYVSRVDYTFPRDALSQDEINPSDMRTATRCGLYTMNGFTYVYVQDDYPHGVLLSIRWYHDGMYYVLSIPTPKEFKDYPIDTLTPLALLVNIRDESIAFMNELLGSNE